MPDLIPIDEEARLEALERYAILDTPFEQNYDDITRLATGICDTPAAMVTLVDRERQWFKSAVGVDARETPRAGGFCAHAVLEPGIMIVEDALTDLRFAQHAMVTGEPYIRFYAGAPLIAPGGHVLGTICVFDNKPRSLAPRQLAALEALARQVMTQLELRLQVRENARVAAQLRTVEKLAAVGRLASSVAHEINNPLQSISNLLFIAANSPDGLSAAYLAEAQEELSRVSHIVTQSLRFHQQSERPREVRLGELVDSVLRLFRTRFRHASVTVEVRDRQTIPSHCYGLDLRQVIANLVSNALDALLDVRGGRLLIHIADAHDLVTHRPGTRLTFADTGSGIPQAVLARIWEPFFTTKDIRGTGLGLWVTHGILEKHRATTRVRTSRVSAQRGSAHGTVFSIFLPHGLTSQPDAD